MSNVRCDITLLITRQHERESIAREMRELRALPQSAIFEMRRGKLFEEKSDGVNSAMNVSGKKVLSCTALQPAGTPDEEKPTRQSDEAIQEGRGAARSCKIVCQEADKVNERERKRERGDA